MTPILLGFGLGLFAAAVIVGYRRARQIYIRQYEAEIPTWINQGNRPVIISLADREQDIDFRIWELEMEDR